MVGCSSVVVKDYGKESQANDVIKGTSNARHEQINSAFVFQVNKSGAWKIGKPHAKE